MAGMVCAGVEGADIANFYVQDGVKLFNDSKIPWYQVPPRYDRKPFVEKFKEIITNHSEKHDRNITLNDLSGNVLFMATAYNLSSYRTHFVKSDAAGDQDLLLKDVVNWSGLSAAYYFGKVDAPAYKWILTNADAPPREISELGAVFQDGGQATENCTLGYVLTEILARGWANSDQVLVISLGTGNKTLFEEYKDAKQASEVTQAVKYIAGQARKEATPVQIMAARYVAKLNPNITIFRLDYEMDKDYQLDDIDNVAVYKQGAEKILHGSEFKNLVQAL